MNLAIDIGNTLTKCAVFEENQVQRTLTFEKFDQAEAETLLKIFPGVKRVILSSVIDHSKKIKGIFDSIFFIELDHSVKLPLCNLYKTPESLGKDRLASVVAANYMFPFQDVLVIDAGTCIKYDFVNARNEYLGGGISPGINMRYKALNTFTGKLPLLELNSNWGLIGKNTYESICSGVQIGVLTEVKGIIALYSDMAHDLKVVLTGGDWNFFDKELKNSIFADPYLVLKGLNIILNYNIPEGKSELH